MGKVYEIKKTHDKNNEPPSNFLNKNRKENENIFCQGKKFRIEAYFLTKKKKIEHR